MSDEGYGILPRWLRGHLTAYEIAAYVALTSRNGRTGAIFPSHDRIAKDAGMSPATAKRTLASLKAKGLVSWTNRSRKVGGKTSNVYSVSITKPASWLESDGSDRAIESLSGSDEVLNPKDASFKKVVPTDAASRGQRERRPMIDLDALATELDDDTDCLGWLANNWADGADGLVEAAWAELQTNDAIKDKGAWLAAALSNQKTAVGKATRLLKIVGDDYDDE